MCLVTCYVRITVVMILKEIGGVCCLRKFVVSSEPNVQRREESDAAVQPFIDTCHPHFTFDHLSACATTKTQPRKRTLTQKAPTSLSWRCTRCVVVCEKSEVASVEEGHDVSLR